MEKVKILCANLVLLFLVLSCSTKGVNSFANSEIYIKVPKGWKITDIDSIGTSMYMIIEKDGFSSSGIITINYITEGFTADEWFDYYVDILKNQYIMQKGNITFEEPETTYFKDLPAIKGKYTMNLLGYPHSGIIYAFQKNNIAYCYVQQSADEDSEENSSGFETIAQNIIFK